MKLLLIAVAAIAALVTPAAAQRFLRSPLGSGFDVYGAGNMNSVLDHSLRQNPNGKYHYGTTSSTSNGGDGVVVGFNGERANGAAKPGDLTCIAGAILLRPSPTSPASTAMTNTSGCGAGYASYDEHPGYDYRASAGTRVYAAAAGTVVAGRCIVTNFNSCDGMGFIGIDHGNGYITQYGHLRSFSVAAGATVTQGQEIGRSGDVGVPGSPHLHFEVIYRSGNTYYVVDPYGWVGSGNDPLYSRTFVTPRQLWQ